MRWMCGKSRLGPIYATTWVRPDGTHMAVLRTPDGSIDAGPVEGASQRLALDSAKQVAETLCDKIRWF